MISIPKGTKDILPEESYKWHYVEGVFKETARLYDLKEIRTPSFEHTELFTRGVGGTTDIVNKEMYTFEDKGGRSITLKPEGTAGCARAFIENGLQQTLPLKAYYETSVFRYEKPQAGRLREHHQFGIEYFGIDSPYADAEVIAVAKTVFNKLGLLPKLYINSIGCKECRKNYHTALKNYLSDNAEKLCATCRDRLEVNPLRVLDCKNENCKNLLTAAPSVLDYLCDDCRNHHEGLKTALNNMGIDFEENPKIVRGLDYYTRTVFEFVAVGLGSQDTVCGGGRYNNLIEELGGKPCGAVGFGMGVERLLLTLENTLGEISNNEFPQVFVCSMGEKAECQKIVCELRNNGISAVSDLGDRSLKAQMKYADRLRAAYSMVVGSNELLEKQFIVKNMRTGETETVKREELSEYFIRR